MSAPFRRPPPSDTHDPYSTVRHHATQSQSQQQQQPQQQPQQHAHPQEEPYGPPCAHGYPPLWGVSASTHHAPHSTQRPQDWNTPQQQQQQQQQQQPFTASSSSTSYWGPPVAASASSPCTSSSSSPPSPSSPRAGVHARMRFWHGGAAQEARTTQAGPYVADAQDSAATLSVLRAAVASMMTGDFAAVAGGEPTSQPAQALWQPQQQHQQHQQQQYQRQRQRERERGSHRKRHYSAAEGYVEEETPAAAQVQVACSGGSSRGGGPIMGRLDFGQGGAANRFVVYSSKSPEMGGAHSTTSSPETQPHPSPPLPQQQSHLGARDHFPSAPTTFVPDTQFQPFPHPQEWERGGGHLQSSSASVAAPPMNATFAPDTWTSHHGFPVPPHIPPRPTNASLIRLIARLAKNDKRVLRLISEELEKGGLGWEDRVAHLLATISMHQFDQSDSKSNSLTSGKSNLPVLRRMLSTSKIELPRSWFAMALKQAPFTITLLASDGMVAFSDKAVMQASLGLPVPYMNSLSVGEVMSGYRNAEIWGEHLSKVLNRETNYTEVWSLMESQSIPLKSTTIIYKRVDDPDTGETMLVVGSEDPFIDPWEDEDLDGICSDFQDLLIVDGSEGGFGGGGSQSNALLQDDVRMVFELSRFIAVPTLTMFAVSPHGVPYMNPALHSFMDSFFDGHGIEKVISSTMAHPSKSEMPFFSLFTFPDVSAKAALQAALRALADGLTSCAVVRRVPILPSLLLLRSEVVKGQQAIEQKFVDVHLTSVYNPSELSGGDYESLSSARSFSMSLARQVVLIQAQLFDTSDAVMDWNHFQFPF